MTIALYLQLVAAWCGTPVPYKLDSQQVNSCRSRLIECAEKHMYGPASNLMISGQDALSCFKLVEIGK